MKKLFIIIPSNRFSKLPSKTVAIIEKTKTPTIFVKQNLSPFYKNHPYIKEIISHHTGVSQARNLGIKTALKLGAQILAFTDDDCIITQSWVKNIYNTFIDPKIDIVFGHTLPYQPQKHLDKYCPSTFSKKNHQPISWPVSTWDNIGMSNNFAITPKIINQVGYFSTKIGPGTKIPRGEDDDFIIRAIKQNFSIYYNHQMSLYHNKWLNQNELNHLYQQCTLGTGYVYSYHAIHTNHQYLKIVLKTFFQEIIPYFQYLRQITHPLSFIKLINNHNLIIYNFFKGCFYSFYRPL
jgi:GT2 family glycosyltransferase